MNAEAVITALLKASAGLTTLVGDRIYPHSLPEGCELPALVVEHISTTLRPAINAGSGRERRQSRIQVTTIAASYPSLKAVAAQVEAACNYARGSIASVQVNSVTLALIGPDLRDDDRTTFHQPIDFTVTTQTP